MADIIGIVDGGLLGIIKWAVGSLLAYGVKALGISSWATKKGDAWIVYICLVVEYAKRHRGQFRYLKNHCSTCSMVGHNSQNCPESHGVRGWKKFADEHYVTDAIDAAVDKTSSELADKCADGVSSGGGGDGDCTVA
jgi:hypothetical protein